MPFYMLITGRAWEPVVLFGDLAQMATIFAIIGDIAASAGLLFTDEASTDEASIILPRYLDEAHRRIAEYLHSIERAAAILQRVGWTRVLTCNPHVLGICFRI